MPPRGSTGSSAAHPLRIVVFGETPSDLLTLSRWIEDNLDTYELRSKRERVLNKGLRRGKTSSEERYVLYEFVPRRVATSLELEASR